MDKNESQVLCYALAGCGWYYDSKTKKHTVFNSRDGSAFGTADPVEALNVFIEKSQMNIYRKINDKQKKN